MKKICIVTGNRAEYGLLKNLISRIKIEKTTRLQIIATGSHLSKFYGNTYKEILKDGNTINQKIDLQIKKNNSKLDTAKSTSLAIQGFTNSYNELKPDIVVLLGDRYEIFAATFAAMNMNIPVAHIHGGEKTFGSIDDHMRHAITKMSKWHFVSTLSYKKRVIQLGEVPKNIFYVGALAYESILNQELVSKKLFEKYIKMKFKKNNFLLTFHPETSDKNFKIDTFNNLLDAISTIKESTILFTLSNADAGGGLINEKIKKFVKKNPLASVYFTSMGSKMYYSALKNCNIVIGNSSSGILEAPYFTTPSINIGDRQTGRLSAKSVIHSKKDRISIINSIRKAIIINSKKNNKIYDNPYGKLKSSKKIIDVLKNINMSKVNTRKKFYDINQ
tara:strand:- start:285 stop:1451 length:1167 start_codon:yes stop_codon:yes gene_type:complete